MAHRLITPQYLAFPFAIAGARPRLATRAEYVRGLIEQVIFTVPGERVYRPELGGGGKALLFEPNAQALQDITKRRLVASLGEALAGEVDPRSLEIDVQIDASDGARLEITVSYQLSTIGVRERQRFSWQVEG